MNSVERSNLPIGWKNLNLGDLAKFSQGQQIGLKFHFTEKKEGLNRFIRIVDYTQKTEDKRFVDYFNEKHYVNKDDIVMVRYGAIGFVGRGIEGIIANNLFKISPNEKLISKECLFIYLKYGDTVKNLSKIMGASTMPAINFKAVSSLEIPLPPLEEQKRIVAKIDTLFAKIDKAISLTEESLKQAKNLLPSVLKEVFEKEKIKIGDVSLSTVVDILSGVSLPKLFKGVTKRDGNISYYKVAQMNNDSYIMKGALLKFSATEAKQYKIKLFPKGTVLFPKRGGAILTNKKRVLTEDASYDSNTMGLKAKNNFISDEYLFTVLRNIDLSDYIDESTIPQINNKHIDRMRIVLTDLERQKEIVAISDAVGKSSRQTQSKLEEQLAYLKKLKSSILSKTFQGEL